MALMSEQIDQFSAALVTMQSTLKHARLDSEAKTGKYSYKYASLPTVIDTVRSALVEHKFAITQVIIQGHVRTYLIHESGQWMASECPIVTVADGPQALGSAITYARRYGLAALVGIAADDDDDAMTAEGAEKPKQQQQTSGGGQVQIKRPNDPCSEAQRKKIWAALHGAYPGRSNDELKAELVYLCETVGYPSDSREMTKGQASILIQTLEATAANGGVPKEAGKPDDDDLPF